MEKSTTFKVPQDHDINEILAFAADNPDCVKQLNKNKLDENRQLVNFDGSMYALGWNIRKEKQQT